MEYLILFLALLLAGALVFAKGLWDAKRQSAWQKKKMREAFGKKADREYADGEFGGIPRYFEKHREAFFLDDITWNDLDMDEVFCQMNQTYSSAGQEYLYYMLRTPLFTEEELRKREEMMRYFSQQEEERLRVQQLYQRMGRTGKYSIYDYLDFLDLLGKRSNGRQIVMDLLFFPAAALIGVSPQAGLLCLLVLLIVNISTYLKEKRAIEPYLISFQYVFRTLSLAEQLCRENIPVLKTQQEEIKTLLGRFRKLRNSAAWGMRSMGGGGNPLDVLLDYINMILHLDILCFNVMLKQVRERSQEIDRLLTVVGRIDALIAAAGYRQSLQAWCEPVFREAGENPGEDGSRQEAESCLVMEGLYHPLLSDPVKNDIAVRRGVLLTGSNASGKSTFLRAVALNAVLAQTIHTCCADFYEGRFFRIMTSMALHDNLENGESYYIVEIKSLKRILDAAADTALPVLCFVDEVLRGTNTVERIAASTQILKSLHKPEICCFAATHDIELTELLKEEYDNYHFEEEISEGDIRFPYQLLKGKATTRNAIRLLAIMGYENRIIEDAEEMAAHFAASGRWESAQVAAGPDGKEEKKCLM
ncbi:MAG: hypothetical protein Q4C58_14990 [Eubacteriales bacterium]|nr:hypothetical protein [Eubacteriales bacterium]